MLKYKYGLEELIKGCGFCPKSNLWWRYIMTIFKEVRERNGVGLGVIC